MLTLVVEERVEDLLSSVLAVSITAVMTVLIALTVSFFIYRENLQKKFKDLVLELKKRSEESKNLSSDAEDDLTETDDSVEIVRNPSVSDYYTTMIMLMGVFYTLPTLQLVFNYQHTFNVKGIFVLVYKKKENPFGSDFFLLFRGYKDILTPKKIA